MSFNSTTDRVTYSGNGVTTAFAFSYIFFDQSDLVVVVKTNSTGAETTKTISTHYTVSGTTTNGVYVSGGSVNFLTAPASGETVIIYRDRSVTQELDLDENGKIPSENLERQLDKLVGYVQRVKNKLARSIGLKEGFTASFDPSLPALMVNDGILKTTTAGTAFEYISQADLINTITAGAQAFTPDRALQSSSSGLAEESVTSSTELGYLSGVTSSVQDQINAKQSRSYSTTATAAGTTTLTVASSYYQFFTGATTQTITLPVASTMTLGYGFKIVNNSTGNLTVNSSGGNLVATVLPGMESEIVCILVSGTDAASWSALEPIDKSIGTTKGDIIAYSASGAPIRVPVGGTNNNILIVDSGQSAGVKWGNLNTPTLTIVKNTSSIKTPGATNNYMNMTNNDVTLLAGKKYRIDLNALFDSSGGTPTYTLTALGLYGADGADTSSTPTLLTSTSNLTVESGHVSSTGFIAVIKGVSSDFELISGSVIVSVGASNVTLYAVPFALMTTAANARVSVGITAQEMY